MLVHTRPYVVGGPMLFSITPAVCYCVYLNSLEQTNLARVAQLEHLVQLAKGLSWATLTLTYLVFTMKILVNKMKIENGAPT